MKRSLIAVLFATFAAAAYAGNGPYNFEAGEQDFATPIADAGSQKNEEQSFPQVG